MRRLTRDGLLKQFFCVENPVDHHAGAARAVWHEGRSLGHASARHSLAASKLRVEHRFKVELVRLLCLILELKFAQHSPETNWSTVC